VWRHPLERAIVTPRAILVCAGGAM